MRSGATQTDTAMNLTKRIFQETERSGTLQFFVSVIANLLHLKPSVVRQKLQLCTLQATTAVFMSVKGCYHSTVRSLSWSVRIFFKKLDDSHLSALVSFPGSRDCENGKLFISSIKCEHLAFWREEEGKRIKTPTGTKGPPEAKGGSWGDSNGNNKTTEEACFGVLFLIFRGKKKQGKLWPWVNKQTNKKFIFKYFKVSWTLPPAQSNLTRS